MNHCHVNNKQVDDSPANITQYTGRNCEQQKINDAYSKAGGKCAEDVFFKTIQYLYKFKNRLPTIADRV